MQLLVDRRTLPGLVSGLAGFAFGVAGAALQSPSAAVVSGSLALAAGAHCLAVLRSARMAEQEADSLRRSKLRLGEPLRGRSLVDRETNVPDGRFFELTLATRVAAARRHLWPVTIVLVDARPPHGVAEADAGASLRFVSLLQQTLREADVVCRLTSTTFGLLLEDTSEAGGVWAAERVQNALGLCSSLPGWQLTAGVASYPTHGLSSEEVYGQAKAALARACSLQAAQGLGQVEVARSEAS